MPEREIAIVDEQDNVIGSKPVAQAYKDGDIHRVVRVLIFNDKGELFTQRRADHMEVAPGLWDNSVGGHVDAGEDYETAALRETREELGLTDVKLRAVKKYNSVSEKGFDSMRRWDTLFTGTTKQPVTLEKSEVADGRWVSLPELEEWMRTKPAEFTEGFKQAFQIYAQLHPV